MPPRPNSPGSKNARLTFIAVVFALPVLAIGWKLITIQVVRAAEYSRRAQSQQSRQFEIPAKRGELYLEDGGDLYPVALNNQLRYLYADPKLVADPKKAATELAPIVGLDPARLEQQLTFKAADNNRYVELKQQVTKEQTQAIDKLKLRGVVLKERDYRSYPEANLFSHILGYVNSDGLGQYGVEQYLNADLSGRNGLLKAVTDSQGVPISTQDNVVEEPKNGTSYVLTIDRYIQGVAQTALKHALEANKAPSGSIIVMDPYSGAIKAMVNSPDYDPNQYQKITDYSAFINSSITNQFEPGSGFKPLTMSIGLDAGKITPATTFTDPGSVTIGEYTIKNAENGKFGTVDMSLVIKNSINTGMVFILRMMGGNPDQITRAGKELLYQGIQKFGFGKNTGIELANEAPGKVKDPTAADIDYANMTFGQGIATTQLQMISAEATIANGGTLVQPYILAKKLLPNGDLETIPHKPRAERVIKPETASAVASMMIKVVEGGSGYLTRMPGYSIAGKTGTAQVPKAGGGYEEKKNIGSFVGFAPVDNPQFIIMVRVDYPETNTFAERSAVPAFAEVAKELFKYYQIPPK